MNQMSISRDLTNRLRISGPLASDEEVDSAKRALRQGIERMRRGGIEEPTLRELVWSLFKEAGETLCRLPDGEQRWLSSDPRSAWPGLAPPSEEVRQIETEQGNCWAAGNDQLGAIDTFTLKDERGKDVRYKFKTGEFVSRLPITDPSSITRMWTVLGWLNTSLNDKNSKRPQRDKKVFLALAMGMGYPEARRLMEDAAGRRMTDYAVEAVKAKVMLHVMNYLKKILYLTNCPEFVHKPSTQLG